MSDSTNKAVILASKFSFCFVGLASVNAKPTDVWFSHRLAELSALPIEDRLTTIAEDLSLIFSRIGHSATHKRLAILGVGWAINQGRRRPTYVVISNFLDMSGRWLDKAEQVFKVQHCFLPRSKQLCIVGAGAPIPSAEWIALNRFMRKLSRSGVEPAIIAIHLAQFLHYVSQHDRSVGPFCMVCSIPKRSVDYFDATGVSTTLAMLPHAVSASFMYVDVAQKTTEPFSPRIVGGGFVVSKFSITYL